MIAVPFLVVITTVKEAIVVSTLLALGISAWQAGRDYKKMHIPSAARMSIAAVIAMPVGVMIFAAAQPSTLRVAVGVAVITAAVLAAWQPAVIAAGAKTDIAAGALSGALKTSVGVNGPPVVIACHARGMGPPQFRATVAAVLGTSNAAALVMFAAAGQVTIETLLMAAVSAPLVLVGVAAGTRLLPRAPVRLFRFATLLLVGVAGAAAVVTGLQ